MIECNIDKYVDFGDSIQLMNIYSKTFFVKFFKIYDTLNTYKIKNKMVFIFFKIIFYVQLMDITLLNASEDILKNDSCAKVINSIKKITLLHNVIDDKESYLIIVTILVIFASIILLTLLYLILTITKKPNNANVLLCSKILNISNLILQNYCLVQFNNVFLLSIRCKEKKHIFLGIECFKDYKHISLIIVCFFLFIFIYIYTFFFSIFNNEIGSLQNESGLIRINCNIEFFEFIGCFVIYTYSYILRFYCSKDIYKKINRIIICIVSFIILIYNYNKVYFYDEIYNYVSLYGWSIIFWFSFGILIRNNLGMKDSLIFFLVGTFIIVITIYFLEKRRIDYNLTEANIFEAKSLKQIETFINNFFVIVQNQNPKNLLMLTGILNSIQEIIDSNEEIKQKSNKFINNYYLNKKIESKELLRIYNLIYLIYDYYFEKPDYKNNILFIMSYFLINHLKNPTYVAYLCSKVKVTSLKDMYLKFIVMEKLKKYQINKLIQTEKKEKIKHVQIGSLILYNNLLDKFKIKIYDAINNQIDYFDILKNNSNNNKTTENFLKTGEKIMELRKEIIDLWDRIMKLNPFCEENKWDYMLYLQTVIQDTVLAQKEEEKYNDYKNARLFEKNNTYYSLFNKNTSCTCLVDGYNINGKILYISPNFPILFNFNPKECINMTIYDLMPSNIVNIHKEIETYTIKFSNLSFVFNKFLSSIIKGKNNSIFKINVFIKCIPNLSYGLIYIVAIEKIRDQTFIIVLDNNFKITALSDAFSLSGGNAITLANSSVYGLNTNVIGHHIACIIPEILTQIQFNNEDQKFSLIQDNIDLKADLFPNVNNLNDTEKKIEDFLDYIKEAGKLILEENYLNEHDIKASNLSSNRNETKEYSKEYNNFLKELNSEFVNKKYNIFYRLITRRFINNKHIYYRLNISNDLINLNNSVDSKNNSINNNNKNENMNATSFLSNVKLPNLNESNINCKNKIKGIPIKVTESEKQPLIQEKNNENSKKEEENDNEKKKNNNNINDNNLNNNFSPDEIISQTSATTQSFTDDVKFNNLKLSIINQREPKLIFYMRLIVICYCIISIFLIVFDVSNSKQIFSNLKEYLLENLIFNRTKTACSCVFNSAVNLKLIKFNAIPFNRCDEECRNNTLETFYECLTPLKNYLRNTKYFHEEFDDILRKDKPTHIYAYDQSIIVSTTLTPISILFLLVSNILIIYKNFDEYLSSVNSTYDPNFENIINQSYHYIFDESISGFKGDVLYQKTHNHHFNKSFNFLIANCIIFISSLILIFFMVYKLNDVEKYFLKKLIRFQNLKFENYLKYLEDLKKKLRNDSGEEEELIPEEKNKQSEEDEENNLNKNNTNTNSANNRRKSIEKKEKKNEENEHGKKKKKKNNKLHKLQQQRDAKYKIMSKYFLISNLIFIFKYAFIVISYMSYYVFIFLIFKRSKNSFFNFDQIVNYLGGLFKTSSMIFVKIRKEYYNNIYFTYNKDLAIESLNNNNSLNIEFDGNIYSYENISILSNLRYKFNINDIDIPSLGNVLLPIIEDVKDEDTTSDEAQIKQLFNGDACSLIFKDDEDVYQNCVIFWSSIFLQGYEQVFIQLSVFLVTYKQLLEDYSNNLKDFDDIALDIISLDFFIDTLFFKGFLKINSILSSLRAKKVDKINNKFIIIMWIYIIICGIFFFILNFFIIQIKHLLISFLNFVGIFPLQYLIEDEDLYLDVLNLKKSIY